MQYTNPITIDGTLTARITFIIFIILLFLIICGFSSLEMKLVNKQAKEVDRYMVGVIANKLLHSPQDYKKASLKKSRYLLFKRTWISFTFLVISIIIFLSYIGGVFSFRLDNNTSIEEIQAMTDNVCHWGLASFLNFEPIFIDTGWGFNFIAGFSGSIPFNGLTFYVIYTNITAFIVCLWIFIQLQGFAVRFAYTNHVAETSWNFQGNGLAKD